MTRNKSMLSDASGTSTRSHPRILFVNHAAVTGGAELVLLDVAKAFRASCEVVLFADGPFRSVLAADGVSVSILEAGDAMQAVRREHGRPSIRAAAEVVALAVRLARRSRGYDVLYANSQKAFVVACAAGLLSRRPVVWHLHDLLSEEHFSRANIRLDITLGNRIAARILAVSQAAAAAFVRNGGDPRKVFVVHNGIDDTLFSARSQDDVSSVRFRLGVNGHPLIGCFSRLAPWKGQHVLLEALPQLPLAHAIFVGDPLFGHGDYLAYLTERSRVLGIAERVHFLGHRTDVPVLMQAMDIVVHSPVAPEPFGRVVAEAMLAGTPLVAARAGGPVEMIRDGVDGMFFQPGSADDLARVLEDLVARPDRARALAESARSSARARFTREKMVSRIADHLRELVPLPH